TAGPRRFVELPRVLPVISTDQLRSRLNRMVADGLLTRQRYREVPPRVDYELTERSRELIPVLGALARWGYDWTWSAPRAGEDINVGAIFRLAPGLLEPPAGLEGTVELIVEAEGEAPERQFLVTLKGGRAEVSEVGGAQPTASVRGAVDGRRGDPDDDRPGSLTHHLVAAGAGLEPDACLGVRHGCPGWESNPHARSDSRV